MRVRFCFSADQQARIDATSLAVADVPYAAAPPAGQPYPQALRLSFRLNGAVPPPQVVPLFPGLLRFIPDPAATGTLPKPEDVQLTDAAYATWRTVGTLRVALDVTVGRDLPLLLPGLEVLPNVVWYSPVRISRDFLFTSLLTGLARRSVGGTPSVGPNNPAWEREAVSAFLAGRYEPVLAEGASASADDAALHPLPTVAPADDQSVTLFITVAARQDPQDGLRRVFDDRSAGVDADDPAHKRNGAIPARHVLRMLRPHLIDAPSGAPIPDRILEQGGTTPRYHALRFTRTWQVVPNCSVTFPEQQAVVADDAGNSLATQRLAAHGVLWLSSPSNGVPPRIRVTVNGDMRWIDGATGDVWRHAAGLAPLAFDLSAVPSPHVQLRMRMSEAMLVEPRYRPGGPRCTYMSMRRSLRALVDNRIAGGRLNFGSASTGAPTRALIDAAWAGLGVTAQSVANNRPVPHLLPDVGAPRLIPVFSAFFPAMVPAENIDGSTARTRIYRGGEMAYRIWQSILLAFEAEGTKRNFPSAHVGRGGAGALVATGLAAGYEVDPVRSAGESDNAYFDRIVNAMLTGLEPGAVLQFWHRDVDFEDIRARRTGEVITSYGHSPVFVRYVLTAGNVTAVRIIDQSGEFDCPVTGAAGNRRIEWRGYSQEVWIAANWEE